jgi:hypothetical protein
MEIQPNKAECLALLCCMEYREDGQGGPPTLGDVFVSLPVPRLPVQLRQLVVYFQLRVSGGEDDLRVVLRSPGGGMVDTGPRAVPQALPGAVIEGAIGLRPVPLEAEGEHTVELHNRDGLLLARSFRVHIAEPEIPAGKAVG